METSLVVAVIVFGIAIWATLAAGIVLFVAGAKRNRIAERDHFTAKHAGKGVV